MKYMHDLFLLMFNISQIKDRRLAVKLFCESLSELYQPLVFYYSEQRKDAVAFEEEISTRNSSFGYIHCENLPAKKQLPLVQNAIQMLAIFLERLKFEHELSDKMDSVEKLANSRLEQINRNLEELEQAKLASLNLVEDLTEEARVREQVQKALAESEEKYRTLFNSIRDAILVADTNRKIIHCNTAFTSLFGYTLDEIHGRQTKGIYQNEEEFKELGKALKTHFGDKPFLKTVNYKKKTGEIFPGETNIFYLKNDEGIVTGFIGLIRDITERKQAEAARRQSETNLKKAQEIARLGSWLLDINNGQIEWSDEMYHIYGFETGKLPSLEEVRERIMPEDRPTYDQAFQDLEKDTPPKNIEYRVQHPDGQMRDVIVRAEMVVDKDGVMTHLIGTVQDITQIRRAEEAMRESEERFKALHNASFGGIAIHDKGMILECNKGLSEITGFSYDELIGMNGLKLISDDTLDTVLANINSGYEKPYEAIGVRKNGERYPLRLEARIIPYKGKNVRVVEFRDISERKQAEKEHEKLRAQLTQAQKMEAVGRLAGGVAHDFNNMLGVILGHAEMSMLKMTPDQPFYADLEQIKNAAERSANLTRQLLAFARKQTVAPKVLDINETVGSMTQMLKRLLGEDIDMAWIPGKKIWPVRMDPAQIDQILANLCVNARDAITGIGKITIETDIVSFDAAYCADHAGFEPGKFVMLAVSDDGCGMDAELLDNIFEPFFTTKDKDKGTGLGLATVYGVVRQNNGFINVYSEPGQGTTFKVYIPRYKAGSTPSEKPKPRKIARGSETILLVEDEPAILDMTARMLEGEGYKIISAATPGEAVRLAREHAGTIDMLITDVVMPEMNGRNLARNILSLYPDIRCLFMSGYTADVIAHQGVLEEGVNFIHKPFSMGELMAKVREVLDQNE